MAEEFRGEVVFFGVTNNDTVEAGIEYVKEFDVPYDNANAPEVWKQFGNPFRPSTIVFDRDGNEVHRVTGPIVPEELRAVLQETVG